MTCGVEEVLSKDLYSKQYRPKWLFQDRLGSLAPIAPEILMPPYIWPLVFILVMTLQSTFSTYK